MEKTHKKQTRGRNVSTSGGMSHFPESARADIENALIAARIEKPLLTWKQIQLHQSLTSEKGFSMEAALQRLAEKQARRAD